MQKNYLLFFLLVILSGACRKGEPAEEHFFGRFQVTLLNLPGSGKAEVFLGTEKLGEIVPKASEVLELLLPAGKSGKLKLVDVASSTLIADTNVVVIPNVKQAFRAGYSETLKIKGFISDVNVPQDSIRVQVLYNIRKSFNNYPEADLHLLNLSMEETGIVVKGLKLDDPTPRILTFPRLGEGDFPVGYFCKLVEPKTGKTIVHAGGETFVFIVGVPEYYGHYVFVNINDDQGDTPGTNTFTATATPL
jgi:hypothetical protein